MKFNCGPTRAERMKKKKHTALKQKLKDEQWHKWFAWYPVRIDKNDCRWLETVERIFIGVEVSYTYTGHADGPTGYELVCKEINYRPPN